ncbi:hypothetical protein [Streptomyces spinoverrucosus]|uniref:hypothetical protein n=1 Tax=Streptomyces spinoverrucosus TaxID=284043 RepID=UPI0015815F5E|nr:hypothetical protein [Streptomyces spinoverrucosus]
MICRPSGRGDLDDSHGHRRIPATTGLGSLVRQVLAFGVEGTGSYGATLASFLHRARHKVVEAGRPDRRLRRMNGKPDTLDAENAARAVLAGFATATPKSADGEAEMTS